MEPMHPSEMLRICTVLARSCALGNMVCQQGIQQGQVCGEVSRYSLTPSAAKGRRVSR